ncbi:hypothetical protein AB0L17_35415, partial [Streptomyces cellulosae]
KRNGENGEAVDLLASLANALDMTADEVEGIVEEYTSGIRNSSDLGSRRVRSQQLTLVLSKKLKS